MAVLEDLQPMLAVGTTLQNRYAIVSYLGREGNICSYVVEDVQQEQESAYVLHKFKVQNAAKETRSLVSVTNRLQEALTTLAQLNNYERIPKIITSFIDKNNCYLVQEYIEGQNLAEIIRAKGNLSEAEVITFLQEATEVLSQIHKRQIIHGNIKPSNLIKRSSDGKIVLVNFGVIQTIANPIYDFQKGYIPPEQIAGRLSTSSDIYALGMTAIEALTGIAPENLDKNTETGAVLWQHKGRVSEELANILNKMVYLGQQQRYHSAAQVLKALSKIKGRSKIKPWYKYIFWSLGGLTLLIFGRYLWLQYEAILLFAQADLQLQSQQYEKAIDYYDDGFKKVKGKVRQFERAWLGKATALSHLKRYDEMLQTCDRALKIHQSVYFLNCRGLALEGLEKNQEALAAYNQAIRRDPEFFEALNNRGEVYAKLGETDKAIADFQKAIGVDEAKSYVPWNNLGKLYYKQKDYSKALEAYSQAVNLKEDYLPALIGLGNVEKSQGMYVEALDAYEQATKFYPKSYEAWYAKGLVQEALQQYEEAIRAYERAIALKPDWEIPIKALERVERILGR
jgi:tetratricopeptide (TPR) repeat protein